MSNTEIIHKLYEAFATQGLDRVLELCDPGCVVTQDDALPWGGRFEGLDGVLAFGAALGGTIESVVTSVAMFEAGDQVIQCGRSRGSVLSNGATFDCPEVHVWTLRGGKVTAAEFYVETSIMLRALAGES